MADLLDRNHWQRVLSENEARLGYEDGFKLLFCPWRLIQSADALFLSLNPGRDPSGELMRVASDERGNSYLIKRDVRHSPMAAQYQMLCDLIGKDPESVLAGALMPYRTDRWVATRDAPNINLVRPFWDAVFARGHVREVYCMGREVERAVVDLLEARLDEEIPAGWGRLTLRRYVSPQGVVVYGLLHLSTFKMLSRAPCVAQLRHLFGLDQAASRA